eukprot:363862-Chlamydomonas_euryale.AAC.6
MWPPHKQASPNMSRLGGLEMYVTWIVKGNQRRITGMVMSDVILITAGAGAHAASSCSTACEP